MSGDVTGDVRDETFLSANCRDVRDVTGRLRHGHLAQRSARRPRRDVKDVTGLCRVTFLCRERDVIHQYELRLDEPDTVCV